MMKISTEELGSLILQDEHGEQVTVSGLWRDKPAVLVFVRHFG